MVLRQHRPQRETAAAPAMPDIDQVGGIALGHVGICGHRDIVVYGTPRKDRNAAVEAAAEVAVVAVVIAVVTVVSASRGATADRSTGLMCRASRTPSDP